MATLSYLRLNSNPQKLKVDAKATLAEVRDKIAEMEKSSGICQLFTDRMPLFETEATETWEFFDKFGIKPTQPIFVFFLPSNLKARRYVLDSTSKHEVLSNTNYWAAPVTQTETAQSVFLASLLSLTMMNTNGCLNITSLLHNIGSKLQFSPALLALHNLLLYSSLMNFEKHLISAACYYLFRSLLPESIPDNEVFLHASTCWSYFITLNPETRAEAQFHELALKHDSKMIIDACCVGEDVNIWDVTVLKNVPVAQRKQKIGQNYDDSQLLPVPDVNTLLSVLRQTKTELDLYSIWKGKTNIYDCPDIQRWSSNTYDSMTAQLTTSPIMKSLTFLCKDQIKKTSHHFLTLNKDNRCVYIYRSEKSADSFKVFSPYEHSTYIINTSELLNKTESDAKKLPISVCEDQRPIKEIQVAVIDMSGSMNTKENSAEMTRLELANTCFSSFLDKTISYLNPHAMGVVYFASTIKKIPISRDLENIIQEMGKADRSGLGEKTNLFGALKQATSMILEYANQNKSSLDPKVVYRIFALTDGEDNCEEISKVELANYLQKNHITLDSIMLTSEGNEDLRALTNCTGGWCFKNDTKQNLITLFERETVLNVADRHPRPTAALVVDLPNFRKFSDLKTFPYATEFNRPRPNNLQEKAIPSSAVKPPSTIGKNRTSRIIAEFKNLKESPLELFMVYLNEGDLSFWKIIFSGPSGTPYVNGKWLIYLKFPDNYPLAPPEARFATPIYHCNVNDDGKICHEVLGDRWSFHTTIREIFEYISDMLSSPNADDALDSIKGDLYKTDRNKYLENVKNSVTQHASLTLNQLKAKFNLVDV